MASAPERPELQPEAGPSPAAPTRSHPVRPAFSQALTVLDTRQKPGPGVPAYTRWINRRLARYVAALAAHVGIGPNTVTMLSAGVSAVGLAVLLLADRALGTGVLVAALLALGYLLDSADGQVARVSGRSSPAGEWLDHVVDAIRMPMIHLCTAGALFLDGGPRAFLIIPLLYSAVTTGQFFSQILSEQLAPAGSRPRPRRAQSLLLLPTDTGALCWLYVLWGASGGFELAYGAFFVLNLLHSAVSMRRRFVQLTGNFRRNQS